MRLVGAGFILAAPILLTLAVCCGYRRNQRITEAFERAIENGAEQISAALLPVPKLIATIGMEQGVLADFWQEISCGIGKEDSDFCEVWTTALQNLELPGTEQEILLRFPVVLRSYDAEQIVRELQRITAELHTCRRRREMTFQRDFKARTGVRFSAALLLLILLF